MANDKQDPKLPDQRSEATAGDDGSQLVQRHLTDEHHEITDDDIRNVKVGGPANLDEPTIEAIEDGEKRIADHKADNESDVIPGSQKMTPWDTIG